MSPTSLFYTGPARRGPPVVAPRLALASLALLLAGCAWAPAPTTASAVTVQAPRQWNQPAPAGQQAITVRWWQDFGSAELDQLVTTALLVNRDLRIMAARMAQARALADGAAAERRPQLGASALAQRGRDTSTDPRVERSALGLQASWEVDVFGRAAGAVDAATADADGAAEALAAARIALAADVASAYFSLRTGQQRLRLANDSTALAELQLNVAQRKFTAGQVTALDLERWRAELAQERALAAELDGVLRVRQQQMALLLGVSEAPLLAPEPAEAEAASAPPPPAPLLPGELLEQRPDVRRQARALDAALARTGVARRELYPRLQINWRGARERLAPVSGSAAPVTVAGLGISLTLPLLDGGRIRANIAVQEARAQEAMADYEKAMLTALADAETALAQWNSTETALTRWRQAQAAGATATQRAERLYEAGLLDLGAVLDARRGQLRAQDAASQAEGARWAAAVALRRAFAGKV